MCSRFFIDKKWNDTIGNMKRVLGPCFDTNFNPRDIHPTEYTFVLSGNRGRMEMSQMRWGYPGIQGGVIFNARAESVFEKSLFRCGMERGRIVIPASGFYEWNAKKEKNIFTRPDGHVLFFSGIYSCFEAGDRFVILTTVANESVQMVHDRMPLILEEDQLEEWIFDLEKAETLLKQIPVMLCRESEYEQLSFF